LHAIDPITRIVRVIPSSDRSNRPLLKWAGGKRQLLPKLQPFYPETFDRYIEPFFGSGAVFFDLHASGRLHGRHAWLVDDNPDLIGCYSMLRDRTDEVIVELTRLAAGHAIDGDQLYYRVRDEQFNTLRRAGTAYTPALAAMLIYLNRTGFNGLFRLNRRGDFNVPVGRYVNPGICDELHLRAVARAFGARKVRLQKASFEVPLAKATAGDFVYCDPPYAPLSTTANFAHYTAGVFCVQDQERLQAAVIAAAERGATVMLSNSSAPSIERLYSSRAARTAGLEVLRVPARRAINAVASARGPVVELLVTNADPGAARLTRLEIKPRMAKVASAAPASTRRSA
jgi:DNA adenine methylase